MSCCWSCTRCCIRNPQQIESSEVWAWALLASTSIPALSRWTDLTPTRWPLSRIMHWQPVSEWVLVQRVIVTRASCVWHHRSTVISVSTPVCCPIIRLDIQLTKYRKQRRGQARSAPIPYFTSSRSLCPLRWENLLSVCDVTPLCLCSHKFSRNYNFTSKMKIKSIC